MQFTCEHCGETADRPAGHVNRAPARGLHLYCDRVCMGLARRQHKTRAQKAAEKRVYDIVYRELNAAMLKAKKAEYFRATYDPSKAAAHRKMRMPYHVEYCRQPAYRVKKRTYDRKRRAAEYGPASEAWMILLDINREVKGRMNNYEIKQANGTFGKRQARGREAAADQRSRDRNRAA